MIGEGIIWRKWVFLKKKVCIYIDNNGYFAACLWKKHTETENDIARFCRYSNINLETCEDEGIKPYEEKLGNGNVIPYYVPLEEIAQKIEYLYAYQNMLYGQA